MTGSRGWLGVPRSAAARSVYLDWDFEPFLKALRGG